jgi:hypothetical protein
MAFSPKYKYLTTSSPIDIKEFHDYANDFVTRPPYQRKAVWPRYKKQQLMDSLFRGYYIPSIVIRDVRLDNKSSVKEIIDGQQRITAVQDFFNNEYKLPKSLIDISSDLPGKKYENLSTDFKRYVDKLKFNADTINNIDEVENVEHQLIATDIFWRLQQGESLNYMEIAHAQLSSLTRNFIVKYSDDQTFDFEKYRPVDNNPSKHKFFSLINVDNSRMRHLQFMARFLLVENGNGYADLSDTKIRDFVDEYKVGNGINNYSYENEKSSKEVLKNLTAFYEIFSDDPIIKAGDTIKEFSTEYFIISIYTLVRHLRNNYVLSDELKTAIRNFTFEFHGRWRSKGDGDIDILTFSESRQQGGNDLEVRDRIIRQLFFQFVEDKEISFKEFDSQRLFSELQRIILYRRDKGQCQECLREEKPSLEAHVDWKTFQADHVIAYSKGGKTNLDNAELLCQYHNASKSNK